MFVLICFNLFVSPLIDVFSDCSNWIHLISPRLRRTDSLHLAESGGETWPCYELPCSSELLPRRKLTALWWEKDLVHSSTFSVYLTELTPAIFFRNGLRRFHGWQGQFHLPTGQASLPWPLHNTDGAQELDGLTEREAGKLLGIFADLALNEVLLQLCQEKGFPHHSHTWTRHGTRSVRVSSPTDVEQSRERKGSVHWQVPLDAVESFEFCERLCQTAAVVQMLRKHQKRRLLLSRHHQSARHEPL